MDPKESQEVSPTQEREIFLNRRSKSRRIENWRAHESFLMSPLGKDLYSGWLLRLSASFCLCAGHGASLGGESPLEVYVISTPS
jgi:hypothetical protein